MLIVGLAPGHKGANRTGHPFTGDFAADLLYETLQRHGFARGHYEARADDGLKLIDCRISNAVRCVPPENRPLRTEIASCRTFPTNTVAEMRRLRAILALGRAVGARERAPDRRGCALRQLSLLASEHQHRQAHAEDVRRGDRKDPRSARLTFLNPAP
jgi:uracil-DNA glycosylase